MNIRVLDLRRFQKLSSHISGSRILPSSNCIKFGGGTMIKNALDAFVSMDCAESTEEILVDESVLWPLVAQTPSEFINIITKGDKTTISDGRDKIPCPFIPSKEFNELPVPNRGKVPISSEFLLAIGKASEACTPMSTPANQYMYLHIGQNSVCAGNGFMGVCVPIEEDYLMVIEKKSASFMSKMDILQISESEGHYFFYGKNISFGFSKQSIGYFDMKRVIIGGGDKISFSVSSSDILSFNGLAMSLSKSNSVITLSTGKIEMYDFMKEISPTRELAGVVIPEPFSFKPENMNMAIIPLDVETLDFYDGKGLYYIRSTDTKATSIIAKISK